MKMIDWKEQAKSAIKNGFNLVPLAYGQKFPTQKNWTSINLKEEDALRGLRAERFWHFMWDRRTPSLCF